MTMTAERKSQKRDSTAKAGAKQSGMFSAASFAGVMNEFRSGPASAPDNLPSPPVLAFYGFRGGAGRATALAHVAAVLSSRQVSVVAVDLDLEAPGLRYVLGCPEPKNEKEKKEEEDRGVLALLRTAATVEDDGLDDALRLAPHVVKSQLELGAPIRVLPAGQLSQRYLERLEDLGVPLWHIAPGPSPLEAVVARVKEELQPQGARCTGQDRLFPRTLVQLLAKAVEHQRSIDVVQDRVLRSTAIQTGYAEASKARVDDLGKEYVTMASYLSAISGMKPTGTQAEILLYLKNKLRKKGSTKGAKGAPAGALHAGPGRWGKVIERLLAVGVLREYRRAKGEAGEKKYEISLLYRPGLGIKAFGI